MTARPTPSRSATGVKFHDGSPLTAADVAASWNEIIFPPEGVISAAAEQFRDGRQGRGARSDDRGLPPANSPTDAFLPALADPYAWIYKKAILDKDPRWYEKNILGSGPFKFVELRDRPVDQGRAQPRLLS